jgi:hypothetical protein
MIKKALLLLGFVGVVATATRAQHCVTDEVTKALERKYPGIAENKAQLEREIAANIQKLKFDGMMRGTVDDTDTSWINIPVVVHVVHDYGAEYVSDDKVYTMIRELNATYSKMNTAELANVIPTFVPYIGNLRIRFTLATKDPSGNPTHGITRRRSYLTVGGDDQAKLDYWPQQSYLNIWLIRTIGFNSGGPGIVAAYSQYPFVASFNPFGDGLIANYQFINATSGSSNTIAHEIGHYLNLKHPWGDSNSPGVNCGDDEVDDTPPTKGHFSGCDVYDVTCAFNYTKNGVDYPDTVNTQNIMDYASCELMFTKGQGSRTRAALRSTIGARSNLWSAGNLAATGALAARPSLPPVADFSPNRYFACTGSVFVFTNRSWNDTVNSVAWTFSNNASSPTSTNLTSANTSFSTPGWATVTLAATGLHGNSSVSKQAVYVADQTATPASGYYQEFASGGDIAKYPVFNYYNTERGWGLTGNAGVYDRNAMMYTNKDTRSTPVATASGSPAGDYSDFFTPGFDISAAQFAAAPSLTFFTAGAARLGSASNLRDVLEISYSTDCGNIWRKLDSLTGTEIANNATRPGDFTPTMLGQWRLQSVPLPLAARTGRVFFRFRYKAGASSINGIERGTGNNFYLDRINITSNATGINEQELDADGIAVAPNPTSGNAWIMLSGKNTGTAEVQVTDITGKLVYRTSQAVAGSTRIEIPASVLTVKGMYLVQVATGTGTYSRKLVVL